MEICLFFAPFGSLAVYRLNTDKPAYLKSEAQLTTEDSSLNYVVVCLFVGVCAAFLLLVFILIPHPGHSGFPIPTSRLPQVLRDGGKVQGRCFPLDVDPIR